MKPLPCRLLILAGLALIPGAANADAVKHWAFQPPALPPLPAVKDASWPRGPLDQFILAGLEKRELRPAPSADRRTLIRRITFDLTGLPPTPDEVEAFVNDASLPAVEKLVDRLLASPAYGERWGRHWLDVARYADSNGLDENVAHGNAWRYRDHVIAAFNRDQPYDQFLIEQLAGDLLPDVERRAQSAEREEIASSRSALHTPRSTRQERLIATGFLALGPKVLAEVDERKMEMDIVDEQIDTVGRAFLGLTVGCARCHDHKFDPLSAGDYYALAGIFLSTKTMESFKKIARWHENPLPSGKDDSAMGVTEGKIADAALLRRGSHLAPGKAVPRRFPEILAGDKQPPLPPTQSGRLELARWLVRTDHPLTARVMVNRLWRWHFGQGLVRSVDNFGLLGEKPSHSELLDWLALRFVESGWSVKAMHRLILLSSTYQMSSVHNVRAAERDPDNRLLWRVSVRRLEAEAIRDSLLAVGDALDRTMGGSMLHVKNREFLFDHTSKDATRYDSRRRSVYLPVIRNNLYSVYQLFDSADPAVSSGDRTTTTVATQALFALNSDLAIDAAHQLAGRVIAGRRLDDVSRVRRLYQLAYGRLPTAREVDRGSTAVAGFEQKLRDREPDAGKRQLQAWAWYCQVLLASNEFVYVN